MWFLKKCWYRTYQKVLFLAMCFMDWLSNENGQSSYVVFNHGVHTGNCCGGIDGRFHAGQWLEMSRL